MDNHHISIRRLHVSADENEAVPPGWFLIAVEAELNSAKEATTALERIKQVMATTLAAEAGGKGWPGVQEWKNLLPGWLLSAFRPEYSIEEKEKLLKNNQPRKGWALEDWHYYFKNRVWEWWGGKTDKNKLILEILVDGHPYSIYELECLLELAGAKSIRVND